jgi:hypothetical protein
VALDLANGEEGIEVGSGGSWVWEWFLNIFFLILARCGNGRRRVSDGRPGGEAVTAGGPAPPLAFKRC